MKLRIYLLFSILALFIFRGYGQTDVKKIEELLKKDFSIDMQWFLSYMYGKNNGTEFNEFTLKRGYVNIKKGITDKLSGRITTDLTVDQEGDGKGDIEIRLKYLYLKYKLNSFAFLHKPYFEIGLVHRPWIDFEQQINQYRIQSQMFLERNSVINSADFGIVFMSMLGGELGDDYKKKVNSKFAGKYGSISFGVFNGGGYHALENNVSKTFEGRLTIRPVHQILPGLQLTYHGAIGHGNIEQEPHWHYHSGYLSFENQYFVLTGELYNGNGNYKGSAIYDTISYRAVPQEGYSAFGEFKIFKSKASIIGRYDHFTEKTKPLKSTTDRYITGIAYHFARGSKILLDYEYNESENGSTKYKHIFEVAMEIRF